MYAKYSLHIVIYSLHIVIYSLHIMAGFHWMGNKLLVFFLVLKIWEFVIGVPMH
jgi:hypothetical protein